MFITHFLILIKPFKNQGADAQRALLSLVHTLESHSGPRPGPEQEPGTKKAAQFPMCVAGTRALQCQHTSYTFTNQYAFSC